MQSGEHALWLSCDNAGTERGQTSADLVGEEEQPPLHLSLKEKAVQSSPEGEQEGFQDKGAPLGRDPNPAGGREQLGGAEPEFMFEEGLQASTSTLGTL